VFATMVLVGSAVLARAYFIHESFDTLAGVEATSTPMYQGALIEDVLDIYEARSSNYEAIISGGAARAPVVAISTATSTDDTTMATSSDERAAESEDIVE
jgi:hypothetical protein